MDVRARLAGLMRRGEIRWYRFGRPDKKRPVLILTRQSALAVLREVTIAPITATIRDIPTEILLTEADGVPRDSAVNLDHLQTVPMARVGALIATLPGHRMTEVRRALLFALGFDRE
jgi:mRNA interferase MazF